MLSFKLAWGNLKKGWHSFAPFLIATTTMFSLIFIVAALGSSPSLTHLYGGKVLGEVLSFAIIILALFAFFILIYSYRFLQLQRSREFGLYDILGFKKSRIMHVAGFELVLSFIITFVAGSVIGIAFSKFMFLIFTNMIGGDFFNLLISPAAFIKTGVIFIALFIILFIIGCFIIMQSSSLDLLKETSKGEREPRANFILAFAGLVLLGIGYWLALTVTTPVTALLRFMIAVAIVIVGTYLFFISFTVWYLKWRKKQASFYQPKNFISISSMLYRMKQNSLGLANITILLSMALVTIVTTIGIFFGTGAMVRQQFPMNAKISTTVAHNVSRETVAKHVEQVAAKSGSKITTPKIVNTKDSMYILNQPTSNGTWTFKDAPGFMTTQDLLNVSLVTQADLRSLGTPVKHLAANEVAVYNQQNTNHDATKMNWFGHQMRIVQHIRRVDKFPIPMSTTQATLIVLPNQTALEQALSAYNKVAEVPTATSKTYTVVFDIRQQDEQRFETAMSKTHFQGSLAFLDQTLALQKATIGGFMFVGFVLGISFILGAALIIYYKQISEGAQDQNNFRILQEVGLSKRDVAATIKTQVRTLFFLPIIVTIVHFAFAYKMISKSIDVFGISDGHMVAMISIVTVIGLIVIYWLIYKLTSRIYYKIVER